MSYVSIIPLKSYVKVDKGGYIGRIKKIEILYEGTIYFVEFTPVEHEHWQRFKHDELTRVVINDYCEVEAGPRN